MPPPAAASRGPSEQLQRAESVGAVVERHTLRTDLDRRRHTERRDADVAVACGEQAECSAAPPSVLLATSAGGLDAALE